MSAVADAKARPPTSGRRPSRFGHISFSKRERNDAVHAALLNAAARAISMSAGNWARQVPRRVERVGQGLGIAGRHKHAIPSILEDFPGAVVAIGGDHRCATGHRFHQHIAESLGPRRQDKCVRATEPWQRVCPKADEADRLAKFQRRSLLSSSFVQWAAADISSLPLPPRRCKANALSNVS